MENLVTFGGNPGIFKKPLTQQVFDTVSDSMQTIINYLAQRAGIQMTDDELKKGRFDDQRVKSVFTSIPEYNVAAKHHQLIPIPKLSEIKIDKKVEPDIKDFLTRLKNVDRMDIAELKKLNDDYEILDGNINMETPKTEQFIQQNFKITHEKFRNNFLSFYSIFIGSNLSNDEVVKRFNDKFSNIDLNLIMNLRDQITNKTVKDENLAIFEAYVSGVYGYKK